MFRTPLLSAAAAAVLLLLSGCASLGTAPAETAASRTYPDGRDAVWQRILSTSARKSMFIRQADHANGVIAADREIFSPQVDILDDMILDWADCPVGRVFERTLSQRVEVNYVVRQERDGTTTVTLNGAFREHRLNVPLQKDLWVTCTSTGVLEKYMLDSFYYDHSID